MSNNDHHTYLNSIAIFLNAPWTLALLFASLISVPVGIKLHYKPFAITINVRSFWYYRWVPQQRGVRAMTLGNTILLGPSLLEHDFEHELVHIDQHARHPFIHPFLNLCETIRHGYRSNKYEVEAYTSSGSKYLGRKIN